MIEATVGFEFTARVEAFPAGLTGQVGVQIIHDATGLVIVPRTTLGITEDPAGSGSYIVTLVAPSVASTYSVFWDWDGGPPYTPSHTAAEQLVTEPYVPIVRVVEPPLPGTARAVVPHFSMPLRFIGSRAATVEQDTVEEIADSVANICRYETGSRPDKPGFGVPDQTFAQGGADAQIVAAAVRLQEPRAEIAAAADGADLADYVARVLVDVDNKGGS